MTTINLKDNIVLIGKITKIFGIKGMLILNSYCIPPNALEGYKKLYYFESETLLNTIDINFFKKKKNNLFLIKINKIDSIERAMAYINKNIYINRNELKELENNEYFWNDLIGLSVINDKNFNFGIVSHLFSLNSNDVLVVKNSNKKTLIPFIDKYIDKVDFFGKTIYVSWEEDF